MGSVILLAMSTVLIGLAFIFLCVVYLLQSEQLRELRKRVDELEQRVR